ncbi:hypothetical protein B6N60_04541 [Richelia sinica FACHB-800]|uniref:Uncharacterized protein n=1 Tax=Richelia sinica FACHB-800 TaxID=1357546 RepID=A0A975TBL8_9NOST|nr:hypothetical protein B6N60_04541 [Richelia sinica FACHB-800]
MLATDDYPTLAIARVGFTQCVGCFWRIGIIFSGYKLNKQDEIYSLKFIPVYSVII